MLTHAPDFSSFINELLKLAGITEEDAAKAMSRLQELESTTPSAAEISRGALAGSSVGLLSSATNQLVSGRARKVMGEALKARKPGFGGLAQGIGRGALEIGKGMAGSAAGTAVVGTTLPFAKRMVDERAERAKLKAYMGEGGSPLRQKITEYTGM
jgi:hypothetical protein